MSFRARLLAGFALAALVPLLVLAAGVRREMRLRLDEQADRRARALAAMVRDEQEAEVAATRARLRSLAAGLADDNRFRAAVLVPDGDRRWLLDWAGEAMRLGGLAVLQLQDADGRILSSGHFRNDYDRLAPEVPAALAKAPGGALLRARTPDREILTLAAVDSFAVAGRRFSLVGGRAADSVRLAGDGEVAARLRLPGDSAADPAAVVDRLPVPLVRGAALDTAQVVVTRDLSVPAALRRSVDRWFLAALASTLALAAGVAWLLAGRVARPLDELAEKTGRLDLDRLDQRFDTGRDDEIGRLARLLDAMTLRLRTGAARLREAERRAATGDLARQVNHDIKNGLAPIRHVLRHLAQVAEQDPAGLAEVFRERKGTLDSSVAYLEELARNYAKLSPALDRGRCDPNAVVREVATAAAPGGARIETRLGDVPAVRADPLVLRRILENLVGNALDSLAGAGGTVVLGTRAGDGKVAVTVADTGRGMTREELGRAFDDFYTTKAQGTGLGLSVVRRLVLDLGGALRVETAPGEGSRFIVEIPAA